MKETILHALKERSFSYLWLSEIFTQLAVNIFNFYLVFVVFSLTHSNTAVSIAVLTFTLPAVFIGVIAGVYVDYWNKKHVLLVTNIVRALILLVLIFFSSNLIALYIFSFLFTAITLFFIPAETPLIPIIVRKTRLYAANALFGLGLFGSMMVAFILSGPFLQHLGVTYTLVVLALFLLISSLFVSFIKLPKTYETKIKERTKSVKIAVRGDIVTVLRVMRSTKEVHHSLILLALSQILILVIAVLAPGYATEVLGIRIEEFPTRFIAPAAFGVLVGAILLINLFSDVSKRKIITFGIFLSGLSMLILPYGSRIASREIVHTINNTLPGALDITTVQIVTVIAFLLGFANSFVFVPSNTILQEKTSDELRGKVYGFLHTTIGIFSLLPILIVGGLSDLIGVSSVITGIGVSLLLFGFAKIIFRL